MFTSWESMWGDAGGLSGHLFMLLDGSFTEGQLVVSSFYSGRKTCFDIFWHWEDTAEDHMGVRPARYHCQLQAINQPCNVPRVCPFVWYKTQLSVLSHTSYEEVSQCPYDTPLFASETMIYLLLGVHLHRVTCIYLTILLKSMCWLKVLVWLIQARDNFVVACLLLLLFNNLKFIEVLTKTSQKNKNRNTIPEQHQNKYQQAKWAKMRPQITVLTWHIR